MVDFAKMSAKRKGQVFDCLFCPAWFITLEELSQHVKHACAGVSDATLTAREDDNRMIPKPTNNPPPQERGTAGLRLQFFKVNHLQGKSQQVSIDDVIVEQTQFSDVQVKIHIGEDRYLWGLRLNSLAFAALYAMFGEDEKTWKGKTFTAEPEYNKTFEQMSIVVKRAEQGSARARK